MKHQPWFLPSAFERRTAPSPSSAARSRRSWSATRVGGGLWAGGRLRLPESHCGQVYGTRRTDHILSIFNFLNPMEFVKRAVLCEEANIVTASMEFHRWLSLLLLCWHPVLSIGGAVVLRLRSTCKGITKMLPLALAPYPFHCHLAIAKCPIP